MSLHLSGRQKQECTWQDVSQKLFSLEADDFCPVSAHTMSWQCGSPEGSKKLAFMMGLFGLLAPRIRHT